MTAHVIVALSGGVDSAVAAARLIDAGYRVSALFMKNWDDDDGDDYCPAAADYRSARAVCEQLEIPLHAANFAQAYRERVFGRFLADYAAGLTPNPDVLCNREIKFDVCWRYAQTLGADLMATGHYARTHGTGDGVRLLASRDHDHDQTYFLHTVDIQAFARTLFPVGDLTKSEVRATARRLGLPNADRKGSSGICFIGERRFAPFLRRYLADAPGPIQTVDGRRLGDHRGLMYYTIGQRQGLGIGGAGAPWYVAAKRPADRALIVVQGHDHPALYHRSCQTAPPQWLGSPPLLPWRGHVKIRYRQPPRDCIVAAGGAGLQVAFTEPARAVTPGQSAVFYDGEMCLGGAVIVAATNDSVDPGPALAAGQG